MTMANYFAIGFLVLIGVVALGSTFLALSNLTPPSLENSATKPDLLGLGAATHRDTIDLKNELVIAISANTKAISDLVNEIRQERNERNHRP